MSIYVSRGYSVLFFVEKKSEKQFHFSDLESVVFCSYSEFYHSALLIFCTSLFHLLLHFCFGCSGNLIDHLYLSVICSELLLNHGVSNMLQLVHWHCMRNLLQLERSRNYSGTRCLDHFLSHLQVNFELLLCIALVRWPGFREKLYLGGFCFLVEGR